MSDQTDEAQAEKPPARRMTTAEAAAMAQNALSVAEQNRAELGAASQNASAALRVANGADDMVAAMSEKITDLETRLGDLATGGVAMVADPSAGLVDADGKPVVTRDQVDSRIHEALQPLHDEVHELRRKGSLTPESQSSLRGILARLEAAERGVAAVDTNGITVKVAQEMHPVIADLRRRMSAIEETRPQDVEGVLAKQLNSRLTALTDRQATVDNRLQSLERSLGNPVGDALTEDHLAGQVQAMVDRKVAAMFEETGLTPARLAMLATDFDVAQTRATQLAQELQEIRVHLGALDNRLIAGAEHGSSTNGLGAARKVLELQRRIGHIGKEKTADLGKQAGSYKFRGIDDALDAIGPAIRDVGLILSPEILKDETTVTPVTQGGTNKDGTSWSKQMLWTTTKLTVRYTFIDPEDGSKHAIEMVGEGRDLGDKSTSKAASMAFKYGLFQALVIPVNGLDDGDDAPLQQIVDQSSQPASTTDQRADEHAKTRRAADALAAIRGLHKVGAPPAQAARLKEIMARAQQEGLLGIEVEGATLDMHGRATLATLEPPTSEPPMNDEGPGEYH